MALLQFSKSMYCEVHANTKMDNTVRRTQLVLTHCESDSVINLQNDHSSTILRVGSVDYDVRIVYLVLCCSDSLTRNASAGGCVATNLQAPTLPLRISTTV